MTASIDFLHTFIKEFDYRKVNEICDTIKEAVAWAEDYNQKKTNHLNNVYHWRNIE